MAITRIKKTTLYPNGFEFSCPNGVNKVLRSETQNGLTKYEVFMCGAPFTRIYSEAQLTFKIEQAAKDLTFYKEQQELFEKESEANAAALAYYQDDDGFCDSLNLSLLQRGKVLKILNTLDWFRGVKVTRKQGIKHFMSTNPHKLDHSTGMRVYESECGQFHLTEKSNTKTGMDYADYLFNKVQELSCVK